MSYERDMIDAEAAIDAIQAEELMTILITPEKSPGFLLNRIWSKGFRHGLILAARVIANMRKEAAND